jgi:uncharacterized membrane protein YqaE (UPF0057 family)
MSAMPTTLSDETSPPTNRVRDKLLFSNNADAEVAYHAGMLYLLAIILPPVAVLWIGKPFQAVLNLVLTLLFWVPGAVHACLLVHEYKADKRTRSIIDAMQPAAR